MRILTLGLGLAILAAPAAWARHEAQHPPSVEEMVRPCEAALSGETTGDPEMDEFAAYCFGVAHGVSVVMIHNCSYAGSSSLPAQGLASAMAPSSTAAVQAWVNWARANPAKWGDDFSWSFLPVMEEAFPCEN